MATTPEFEAWWATTNLAERRDAWRGWSARDERIKVLEHELLRAGRALISGGCKWKKGCLRPSAWEPVEGSSPELVAELDAMARTALNQPVPASTGQQKGKAE